jgi:Mg2+ and Co2+ transporter CorA
MAEWIDLLDPSEDELRAKLPEGVHEETIQRLLAPVVHDDEPRPRFEARQTYVLGTLLAPKCTKGNVHFQEVDLVVTREVLVTIRKTPEKGGPIVLQLVTDPPGKMAAVAADQVAEQFLDAVDETARSSVTTFPSSGGSGDTPGPGP